MIKLFSVYCLLTLAIGFIGCSSGSRKTDAPPYVGKWVVSADSITELTSSMKENTPDNEGMAAMRDMMVEQIETQMNSMAMLIQTNSITAHTTKGIDQNPLKVTKIDDQNYRFESQTDKGVEIADVEILGTDQIKFSGKTAEDGPPIRLVRVDEAEFNRRIALAKENAKK